MVDFKYRNIDFDNFVDRVDNQVVKAYNKFSIDCGDVDLTGKILKNVKVVGSKFYFDKSIGVYIFEDLINPKEIDENFNKNKRIVVYYGAVQNFEYYDPSSVRNQAFSTIRLLYCGINANNQAQILNRTRKEYLKTFNSRFLDIDFMDMAEKYANMPHKKKKLRLCALEELKNKMYTLCTRDCVNKGNVKDENKGRANKPARAFISLGMRVVIYGYYADEMKKNLALNRHRTFINNRYLTFAYKWNLSIMTEEFKFVQDVLGMHVWYFSDDVIVWYNTGIITYKMYDISTADQCHTYESFKNVRGFAIKSGVPEHLIDMMISDNFDDIYYIHPMGKLYGWYKIKNLDKRGLSSGSVLTTITNSLMVDWLFTTIDEKEDFCMSCLNRGVKMTYETGSSIEKATFLRMCFLRMGDEYIAMPVGSLILSCGKCLNPPKRNLSKYLYQHLCDVVTPYKQMPRTSITEILDRIPLGKWPEDRGEWSIQLQSGISGDIDFESEWSRYDIDRDLVNDFLEQFRKLKFGEVLNHIVVDMMYEKDYGNKAGSLIPNI